MNYEIQPEGNYYDKYNTKNVIEKYLMINFFRKCANILDESAFRKGRILEAGCGEGVFTYFLYQKFGKGTENVRIEAFDISRKCVEKARNRCSKVNFWVGSIYKIPNKQKYDLVVASEVLEHMDHPVRAMKELFKVSKGYVFITVPNEPLWRMLNMVRGKYWRRLGNTPGHVQHWNRRKMVRLILASGGG